MSRSSRPEVSRDRRWTVALVLGIALPALAAARGLAVPPRGEPRLSAALAEPRELRPWGDFAHPAGFAMPARVGGFERVSVTQYDQDGWNLSAGYNALIGDRPSLPVLVTLYVYPRRPGYELDGYFEKVLADIGRQHGDAQPDFREVVELARGLEGRYAAFGYTEPWSGTTQPIPLRSYLLVYPWKTWWVKWRATTPAPIDAERMKAIVDLTRRLLPPDDADATPAYARIASP